MDWCCLVSEDCCWRRTLRLLASIQEEIGTLFVHILQQDQAGLKSCQDDLHNLIKSLDVRKVVDEVNRLADKLVAYLCASESIQDPAFPFQVPFRDLCAFSARA